jgi:hypothetical protein
MQKTGKKVGPQTLNQEGARSGKSAEPKLIRKLLKD